MAIFFTSDTHFGHAGALALYRRPFASVAAMDEGLVERWNAAVGPADEVWHLGDFAIRASAERVADLLALLHGRKHWWPATMIGRRRKALPGGRASSPTPSS
jgi:calcineurin-like phosphoesterase family protein